MTFQGLQKKKKKKKEKEKYVKKQLHENVNLNIQYTQFPNLSALTNLIPVEEPLIWIVSKVGDFSRGPPEGSLFKSYYTEV